MELNQVVKEFEAVDANVNKLERLWKQMEVLLPSGNEVSVSDPEHYAQLKRSFEHIAAIMPAIDSFKLKLCLLDNEDMIRGRVDCLELGEFTASVSFDNEIHAQGEALAEYRFKLDSKRRQLARQAVGTIANQIDECLDSLKPAAKRNTSKGTMPEGKWELLTTLYKSIDAILGNSLSRPQRWGDMARHLHFGSPGDFADIVEHDWPNIRQWIERSLYAETDPIPVTTADLGSLVDAHPTGQISTELRWSALSPADFERLIFNLVDRTPGYENPQWLTHTNAPDRGRDVSVERVVKDALAGTRRQRIILACKHIQTVNVPVITVLKEQMKLWEPPRVDELILVTSGRFSTDAVEYIEKHNRGPEPLRIEMWPNTQLERLLANRPALIAEFGLRK